MTDRNRAAVVSAGHEFRRGGSVRATLGGVPDMLRVLSYARRTMAAECCIVFDGVRPEQLAPQRDALLAAGWTYSELRAWTLFRGHGCVVSVGLRDAFEARHEDVLVGVRTPAPILAELLDRYHELVGVAWRGTAATTALASIRATYDGKRQPLWHLDESELGTMAGPLNFTRVPDAVEAAQGAVHTFDADGAYLGAMGNAELAWSGLVRATSFPPTSRVGYFHVVLPRAYLDLYEGAALPMLVPRKLIRGDRAWVTGPVLRALLDDGVQLHASIGCLVPAIAPTWPAIPGGRSNTGRILRPWAERIRNARYELEGYSPGPLRDILTRAVKRTYQDATGGLQRRQNGGMRVSRPDWAHMFIDGWRCTMLRRIRAVWVATGRWPVAVRTDSLSYVAGPMPPVDVAEALGVQLGQPHRWRLGGWKYADVQPVQMWLGRLRPAGVE